MDGLSHMDMDIAMFACELIYTLEVRGPVSCRTLSSTTSSQNCRLHNLPVVPSPGLGNRLLVFVTTSFLAEPLGRFER